MIVLNDLDELLLTVRDETSKVYINEAIASFRSGAYRASIVSTWIAVAYDIISKIRELAEQGDAEAQKDAQDLESYLINKKIDKLQEFENSLLIRLNASNIGDFGKISILADGMAKLFFGASRF